MCGEVWGLMRTGPRCNVGASCEERWSGPCECRVPRVISWARTRSNVLVGLLLVVLRRASALPILSPTPTPARPFLILMLIPSHPPLHPPPHLPPNPTHPLTHPLTHLQVSLVRMAADGKLAPNDPKRRNYNGVIDAIKRIAAEEGVAKLWEGAAPTVARAILINAGQLAVYSQAKESIALSTPLTGIPLQFVSSLVSATAAVALSCPADVMKSRMQVRTKY